MARTPRPLPDTREIIDQFDMTNPAVAYAVLAQRVAVLTKEKEDMEERLTELEHSYQKGVGIVLALSFVGGIVGFLIAYGKSFLKALFAPWFGP